MAVFGKKAKPAATPSDDERIETLELVAAEQAQVIDAQGQVLSDIAKELAEALLQLRFVMRYFKFKIPRQVQLVGMEPFELKTLEDLYIENRDTFMAGIVKQAMELQHGESVSTAADRGEQGEIYHGSGVSPLDGRAASDPDTEQPKRPRDRRRTH